ncbi:putative von Willebrand factor, type A, von Willebrand factor A-like domain superfamily [Dioscorea sansibarensis]
MDEDFSKAVEEGLRLSKRIYTGKPSPRPSEQFMDRSSTMAGGFLPTAPMAYAVISDPRIVDNPDIPSYQPHVHGRCDPPALIPLQMKDIALEIDCYLDTALVTVKGRWRVHCVMGSKSCDCRVVIPMGEQGSILGVELDVERKSYSAQVIPTVEDLNVEKLLKNEDGGFMKPQYFSCTIPLVSGGSEIQLKACWSQKLSYKDGQFFITIPFNFPEYVTLIPKVFSRQEKIQLNVNSGTEKEVLCQNASHPLKEKARQVGKLSFLYEAEVDSWSHRDFSFSFSVYSSDIFGGMLVQSPPMHDFDQREMFCLYLFPGSNQNRKVFRKEVIFLVDISGSMQGKPLENVKDAIILALSQLTPRDYFDIIAFNEDISLFSPSLELATEDKIKKANQWISKSFVAEGGTSAFQQLIAQPLNKAISLLTKSQDSLPHIFLITDGSFEEERNICSIMKTHVANHQPMQPRISTFGIGSFCNHYFLQMLASIGRGQYGVAHDPDSIEAQMQRWFRTALSPIVANTTIDVFDHLDALEIYPLHIPDLSAESPLIVYGRCQGKLPVSVKAKGILADFNDIVIDLKVHIAKDIPLERISAKQQIDLLTAQAWFLESKHLEGTVIELSLQRGIPSEYTYLVLHQNQPEIKETAKEKSKKTKLLNLEAAKDQYLVQGIRIGFGNIAATIENQPPGFLMPKQPENHFIVDKAIGCCNRLCNCCCCMCCIQTCSKLNDQFVIIMTQLCTALSCLACFECCAEVCCDGSG